jgi:predicted N-acetyltransferase YhbS
MDDTAPQGLRFDARIDDVDWEELSRLYRSALGNKSAEHLQAVFAASRHRCLVRDAQGRLVGAGRAVADGRDVAYIADVVVAPGLQGSGVGRAVMQRLLEACRGHAKIILYSVVGKEGFYRKLGFRRMTTAMAIFADEAGALARGQISAD